MIEHIWLFIAGILSTLFGVFLFKKKKPIVLNPPEIKYVPKFNEAKFLPKDVKNINQPIEKKELDQIANDYKNPEKWLNDKH